MSLRFEDADTLQIVMRFDILLHANTRRYLSSPEGQDRGKREIKRKGK
jgi:hypothetical protein